MIENIPVGAIGDLQGQTVPVLMFDPLSFQVTVFVILAVGFLTGYAVHKYAPIIRMRYLSHGRHDQ